MPSASGPGPILRAGCVRFAFLLALLPLAACMRSGDLGRMEPTLLTPKGEPLETGSVPASEFPITDDERQLRALARNLLTAPGAEPRAVISLVRPVNPREEEARYVDALVNGAYRSAAARYSRLIDDTRNDIQRIEPFFMVARRVADLDVKRDRSLGAVRNLTPQDLLNAKRRIRENMMLIAEVHRVMSERAAMFRAALEKLVIALPSPMAVEAERQRIELERRLAEIQVFASPAFAGPGPAVAIAGPVLK
mgnify:CR=1 FL=1